MLLNFHSTVFVMEMQSEDHKAPHRGPKAGKNALTLTQMMDSELGTKLNVSISIYYVKSLLFMRVHHNA